MLTKYEAQLKTMKQSGQAAIDQGLFFITPDDEQFSEGRFNLKGKPVINLSSCSYLGLELDPRLAEASADAARKFGTQYSSCRAFAQCPLYDELEDLLSQIFQAPTLANLSTTIGHIATLPILVKDNSHLVLDIQSHHCLRMSADYLANRGISSKTIRHNALDQLEQEILAHPDQDIWYLIDGLYSMYGDYAPIAELLAMLDRYPRLHLYVDDAHGTSWTGKNGQGYALEQGRHPRMVVSHSFTKAFGGSGGCVVFPDQETRDQVRLLGGPFYWGSPIAPPVLGTAVASAKLHLDGSITKLQQTLMAKIKLFNRLCQQYQIPLIANNDTPIRYIGLGKQETTNNVTKALLEKGFYASAVCYPSVSKNKTGLRLGITNHLTEAQIHQLVETLAEILKREVTDETRAFIDKAFKRAF
ncbi:aminotransferase class I/II-fold pyridoxal phosphate-dependent enzyme [Thalassomonas sp. RHCl1]|uniref:aminotransferase class I/II-fold pyridoxal phosphate-dependent enzyme n=1 Tax=Thalassomonas sp. RHCl1 TaxID=2995320 RepID=UPI00248B105E|nr:aminotransferase class I/II-fold pyridoxal phosphate-dependent enzyme [Thalassomonas sp. RHCl1]